MEKRKKKKLTREQLNARNEKCKQKRALRTPEEIESDKKKRRERYNNLSVEGKEKYKETSKKSYEKRKHLEETKQRKKEYNKKYKLENKERLKEYLKEWHNKKLKTNDLYKAKVKTRAMIKDAMRRMNYSKNASATKILGCSFEEFKLYLESKFESWMTWDNYGLYNGEPNYGWDIDHIIPLSNGMTINEVYELNHHTNLQPLCSYINRDVKKNK